jgi:hypothetical protein
MEFREAIGSFCSARAKKGLPAPWNVYPVKSESHLTGTALLPSFGRIPLGLAPLNFSEGKRAERI